MKNYREEQRRYDSYTRHIHPIGITHAMRPKSIENVMNHIGYDKINGATILEIGCGQGYLVNHFLYSGASKVVGTDITQQILDTIPTDAYEVYRTNKQKVEFRLEDFEHTPNTSYKSFDIISMFIGTFKLVEKLYDLFLKNRSIHTIVFMVPVREFTTLKQRIKEDANINRWTVGEFKINLAISGEQRQSMIIQRPPLEIIDLTFENSGGGLFRRKKPFTKKRNKSKKKTFRKK
jgi:SAM-dependent methyltransferase